MNVQILSQDLYVLEDGINTGLLVSGTHAVLFNCGDRIDADVLRGTGVTQVDMILLTQYRRTTASGVYGLSDMCPAVIVPADEAPLVERTDDYWRDAKNRWHIYHFMPDTDVLPRSVAHVRGVRGGEVLQWRGYDIYILDTPGATLGGVSYTVNVVGTAYCFCGDHIYGDGQMLNLWSLARPVGRQLGYHGFMAARGELLRSLKRITDCCDILIPAHGPVIRHPENAAAMLKKRLTEVFANYASISGMNFYFPGLIGGVDAPQCMENAEIRPISGHILRIEYTSNLIISGDGAAFLIDCGSENVINALEAWLTEGVISSIEGC